MAGIHSCMLILLGVLTASVEGMSSNNRSTTMANEFLISKWRLWYKSLDINHDGKVSMEDAQECKNNYAKHLDTEKGKIVKEALTKRWDECIFKGRTRDILEQEFVNALNTGFNVNKEKFKNEIGRCFDMAFSAADINEDKSFSQDELAIQMAAYGHQHVAMDNDYFSTYNPTNGLVPVSVVVDYWVDFVTSTDESKGNIVYFVFTADGLE